VPRSGAMTVASVRRDGVDRNRPLWIVRKSWCNSWNRIQSNADQEGSLLIRLFSRRCRGYIVPTVLHSLRLSERYTYRQASLSLAISLLSSVSKGEGHDCTFLPSKLGLGSMSSLLRVTFQTSLTLTPFLHAIYSNRAFLPSARFASNSL
jgi:hypothetical protein